MRSALYLGTVMHARRSPRENVFRYPVYMAMIDLAELPLTSLANLDTVVVRAVKRHDREVAHIEEIADADHIAELQILDVLDQDLQEQLDGSALPLQRVRERDERLLFARETFAQFIRIFIGEISEAKIERLDEARAPRIQASRRTRRCANWPC